MGFVNRFKGKALERDSQQHLAATKSAVQVEALRPKESLFLKNQDEILAKTTEAILLESVESI